MPYNVVAPQPPFHESRHGVGLGHGRAVPMGALLSHALGSQVLLLDRQPAGRLGVVGEEEPDEDGGQDGGDALEDEEPPPGREAVDLVHVADTEGDGTAKGTGQRGRGEDGGDAHGALVGAVPEGQVVDEAGDEALDCC